MAVSVDTVYKTVLYILNKEQRGYVTPSEFNSIADQVQKEIFNSYFPDGNQQNRKNQNNTENDTEFFNMYENTAYKLHPFEKEVTFTYDSTNDGFIQTAPPTLYKVGEVVSTYTGQPKVESVTQLVDRNDYNKITRSKLTEPTKKYPIYYITNAVISPSTTQQLLLKIFPTPDSITANCLTNPTSPNWAFTTGGLGQYIYDQNNSVDFELDVSEQTNIVIDMLKYFGVIVNDPAIINAAAQEAQAVKLNEKS